MKTKVFYTLVLSLFLVGSLNAQGLRGEAGIMDYDRCDPGGPIYGEALPATDQVKIWWEEQGPTGGHSGWLTYIPMNVTSVANLGFDRAFHWGCLFPKEMLGEFVGSSLVMVNFPCSGDPLDNGIYKVRVFYGGVYAPNSNYLVSEKEFVVNSNVPMVMEIYLDTPVLIDGTQNLWVLFYQNGSVSQPAAATYDVGEPNNRWIGDFDLGWFDMASIQGAGDYSWILWAYVSGVEKDQLVPLPNAETRKHAELEKTDAIANLNVKATNHDDLRMVQATRDREGIIGYYVYRSTDGTEYDMVGQVEAVEGQTYYEFIDTPEQVGTYYYQVVTEYADGCLSAPAPSGEYPDLDYVIVGVDEVSESVSTMALYPNPASDNLTIEAAQMTGVSIISILGQVVFETSTDSDTYTLDLSGFNPGVYVVRVTTMNGTVTKSVSVMH